MDYFRTEFIFQINRASTAFDGATPAEELILHERRKISLEIFFLVASLCMGFLVSEKGLKRHIDMPEECLMQVYVVT